MPGLEGLAHLAPHLVLGVGVVSGRDRLAQLPLGGERGQPVTALPVDRVGEAGVALAELDGERAVVGRDDRGEVLRFFEHLSSLGARASSDHLCTPESHVGETPGLNHANLGDNRLARPEQREQA